MTTKASARAAAKLLTAIGAAAATGVLTLDDLGAIDPPTKVDVSLVLLVGAVAVAARRRRPDEVSGNRRRLGAREPSGGAGGGTGRLAGVPSAPTAPTRAT